MPIKDCVSDKSGKKLYCWNDETGTIDTYIRHTTNIENCPPEIIAKLMHLLAEKSKRIKTEN